MFFYYIHIWWVYIYTDCLICTPFTGQTSGRLIIMRYSYEFKIKCVELYEREEYPDTPNGISSKHFKDNIRIWKRMDDSSGMVFSEFTMN